MAEGNGNNSEGMTISERLGRLQASHAKLMTDHAVFWSHRRERLAEQERAWVERKERWAREDRLWAQQRELNKELDARIDKLVSAIGPRSPEGGA